MRSEWLPIMESLVEHLYLVRAATTDQLFRLIESDCKSKWKTEGHVLKWNLRRKLEQYSKIHRNNQALDLYDSEKDKWVRAPHCNVHTLDRIVACELEERMGDNQYYLANEKASPAPKRDQRNRYVLLTDLYTQMVRNGFNGTDMIWCPNIVFKQWYDILKTSDGVRLRKFPPKDPGLLGGIVYDIGPGEYDFRLVGLSAFMGGSRTFKKYMDWVIPEVNGGLYEAAIFVRKSFVKTAIVKSLKDHVYACIYSYEWAVTNSVAMMDAIRWQGENVMRPILEPYWTNGAHVEAVKGVAPTFRWSASRPNGKIEYIDTTLGRPVGILKELARTKTNVDSEITYTVWCMTEEEKTVWEQISLDANSDIRYYVLNNEILSAIELPTVD